MSGLYWMLGTPEGCAKLADLPAAFWNDPETWVTLRAVRSNPASGGGHNTSGLYLMLRNSGSHAHLAHLPAEFWESPATEAALAALSSIAFVLIEGVQVSARKLLSASIEGRALLDKYPGKSWGDELPVVTGAGAASASASQEGGVYATAASGLSEGGEEGLADDGADSSGGRKRQRLSDEDESHSPHQ